MKLKDYMEKLEALLKDHPEAAEFEVVTSKDDDGTGFNRVYYAPCVGHYEDGDFEEETSSCEVSNAVCLN